MKNKTRIICFVIIFLVLLIVAFIIYFRYTSSSSNIDKVIVNDYYNSEFLFNNNYIKPADNITDSRKNNKDLDIHVTNDILYINLLNQSKTIKRVPTGKTTIYYNHLDNDCYEFAALKGNDLYYASTCLSNKKETSFEKVSSASKAVYAPNTYKKGIYVNDVSPVSNFIINTTMKELKYISYKENILGLYDNINKNNSYFDYICADINADLCKNLIVYVTFSKEMVFNDKKIANDKNDNLLIQDLLAILKINSNKKIDVSGMTFSELKKYDYIFEIYAWNKDGYVYTISLDKDSFNNEKLIAKKLSNKKIKAVDYKKNKADEITNVILTENDGKTINLSKKNNEFIMTSTIYDRSSIINSLKK